MSTAVLRRTSLSHVALRTPNVPASADFYRNTMGLVTDPQSRANGVRLGWGHGHYALELLPGSARLDRIGFEVGDDGGPHAVAQRLRSYGVVVSELPDADTTFVVSDPDGNSVHLHGPVSRTGEHAADPGRRPLRIQHVTLATAAMEPMVDFYVKTGFQITDRMGSVFTWLRSNVEHHSLAIVDVGHSGGLDHYSWDLAEWEDFKTWADRLTDLGVPVQWGPGRHGPGGNLFVFFDDLDSNHIELSAEMERFFDDRARYQPRTWEPGPATVNLWGGQVPRWRTV